MFFFFCKLLLTNSTKKKTTTHFVCMNLSYFLCLPPIIYDVLWRKHDGCLTMDTTASRFHDSFVCRILLSLLRCQFWNVSARTCVCVCVSHVKHLLRQLLPQATTNLPPLPLHSPKCWTAMAANNTLLQSTFEVTDAPRYTKQSSFQTYTQHFQDEDVGRLATLNKFFYLNKVERMTHTPGPHQLQKNKYTTQISY